MSKFSQLGLEAERLYVQKELTLKEISVLLGVSQQTLVKWKRDGNWEKKRIEYRRNPGTILETLEKVLLRRLEDIEAKLDRGENVSEGEIDAITKLVASIKKVSKETDIISVAPLIMKEFAQFLKKNENEEVRNFIQVFTDILPGFMEYLWEKYRR
jgi:uncharacterized protein YjcR